MSWDRTLFPEMITSSVFISPNIYFACCIAPADADRLFLGDGVSVSVENHQDVNLTHRQTRIF